MDRFIRIFLLVAPAMLLTNMLAQLNQKFTVNTGNWYYGNGYQSKLAKDLGAVLAGQDGGVFNWRAIQPNINNPTYNWANPDSVIQAIQAQGLDLFTTLRSVVPANSQFSNPCSDGYGQSSIKYSWKPIDDDTVKWKNFVAAVIERYDHDGINDMPGLTQSFNKWRIETEWQAYWCGPYPKDSLASAIEFVEFVNMTYHWIKTKQSNSIVSFAGIDTRHDKIIFMDGYTDQSTYCFSSDCNTTFQATSLQFSNPNPMNPLFLGKNKANMLYILQHALYDELDIHQYGRWKTIPQVIRWIRDSVSQTIPIDFLEGGGPFCEMCEIWSDQMEKIRWNSSYVIYYFITSLANNLNRISWHLSPEYLSFSNSFGDMDLLDSSIVNNQYLKRPAYYSYRFLAKDLFSNANADSVVFVPDANPNIYHYEIKPLGIHVVWSTQNSDNFPINGNGTLHTWSIPTILGDTAILSSQIQINGNTNLPLTNQIPLFYSWGDVLNLGDVTNQNQKAILYPNPAETTVQLNFTNHISDEISCSFYNLSGNQVMNIQILDQKNVISLNHLPSGFYFYELKDDQGFFQVGKIAIRP